MLQAALSLALLECLVGCVDELSLGTGLHARLWRAHGGKEGWARGRGLLHAVLAKGLTRAVPGMRLMLSFDHMQ